MENSKAENEKRSPFASLVEYTELVVLAATIVIVLFMFLGRLCVVDGPSMNQTLSNGEKVLVSNLFYTPTAGDIVVFHQTSKTVDRFNEPIIKRVIAVGGQYVKIDYAVGKVYVSNDCEFSEDEVIDESSYAYFSDNRWNEVLRGKETEIFSVPEGKIFVMGDNRNNSADSRYSEIGMVDCRRVLGKVLLRLKPFSVFGKN